jgi:2-deoxy-D-gluconate 3-dehydrogenase
MFSLEGKVAFVTGGNGGIGLGMAKGFVEQGASVVLAARNESKLGAAVAEISAVGSGAGDHVLAVQCDVTDRASIQSALDATVEKFGGLEIVVNNAGTNKRADEPHLLSDEDWREVIDTNLTSMHSITSLAFPLLKSRGGGKIINIGSMMSIFGSPYAPAYAASKGGVVQYTKSCAIAYAKYNVQVNAILPGWIVTEMTDEFGRLFPDRYAAIEGRTPAGRWGQPSDLAGTAVFLASDASQFVSGVSIPIDGGYSVV